MKKYVVEFIGTFFLVFAIGMAVRSGAALAPLGIAAALTAVIYAGGHVSGAHFNPAVTLAALIRGKFDAKDALPYVIAQLGAAALAALIVVAIHGKPLLGAASHAAGPSLVVEFLFTFALAWVILNVATAKGTAGNSFYGLAIGFTVLAGAISVGGVSGGAFNPAVGLGVVIMGLEKLGQLWIYLAADLAGGAVAALTFNYVNGKD
jgi:aquaporin Z